MPPSDPAPPVSDAGPTVAELTEDDLLALIFPLLPVGSATLLGPGDDAAVVAAPDGRVVVSTDVLVEGRHFRRDWSTGVDVGWRAAMQNLADIAAMGARATSLVVTLVIPGDLPAAWVAGLAAGLAAACGPQDVGVVGGDLSGGDAVVVSVAVHGDLAGRAPVLRSGARAGDVVAHAGVRGRSAAGLALLAAGRGEVAPDLVRAYLRPDPPLAAGVMAALAGATAMLDVSDGLLRDAGRIAAASGVVLDFDPVADAFGADLTELAGAAAALDASAADWVLTGGEDHGLLATFPAGAAVPDPFRAVGRVLAAGPTGPGVLVGGLAPTTTSPGWDHFRG
ncbi:thiamine-phosphate kinase [Pengzhenrongella sicca]|uniref:Thiamine-monophosphate kinase n=1 Tax=Pengzhenrongella sicca TaxID=2819238 RepID=A0A8A4ZJK9_9MICO|nr:thiamine-phosphate kinase [Pengzhenrongella sicca]QTE31551.1 thiamine-phosphate kinase [Pengzhenrongella sicca]